jgi:hypothetical protein
VKLAVEVKPAFAWHDVVLHNDSPFQLTNVVVTVLVSGSQGAPTNFVVKCKSIPPHSTYSQANAITLLGNAFSYRSTYACDQAP